MRFAITGVDRYLGVFEAFVHAGWQPVKLFTMPIPQPSRETNHAIIAFAEARGISIQMSKMTEDDLRDLQMRGCDVLIVASYKWRIGNWQPYLKYAVNFHSSPLPEGRGPYPVVRAILEQRKLWGVTCHKVSEKFDSGDILAVQRFLMSEDECHETIDLKVQIAARRLATAAAENFIPLWGSAKPQEAGTYWPRWTLADQMIDFNQPVAAIMRRVRAFGLIECLAFVNQRWLAVRRAVGWEEPFGPAPGTVVHINNRTIVVAAANGYIGLIEWDFANEAAVAELSAIKAQ